MQEYLVLSILITLFFGSRRIVYHVMNGRDSKTRKTNWRLDAFVLVECLILFNPFLIRFVFINVGVNPYILAFIYVSMLTVAFLGVCFFVQKELEDSYCNLRLRLPTKSE